MTEKEQLIRALELLAIECSQAPPKRSPTQKRAVNQAALDESKRKTSIFQFNGLLARAKNLRADIADGEWPQPFNATHEDEWGLTLAEGTRELVAERTQGLVALLKKPVEPAQLSAPTAVGVQTDAAE